MHERDNDEREFRRLERMLWAILVQNEQILAKLEQRDHRLSPKDQAIVDEIFDIEKSDAAKIKTALDPAPGGPLGKTMDR